MKNGFFNRIIAICAAVCLCVALFTPLSSSSTYNVISINGNYPVPAQLDGTNFRPDLAGQHPRIILGTCVSLEELARRADPERNTQRQRDMVSMLLTRAGWAPPAENIIPYPNMTAAPGNPDIFQTWVYDVVMAYRLAPTPSRRDRIVEYVEQLLRFEFFGEENGAGISGAASLTALSILYDWTYDLDIFNDAEKQEIRSALRRHAHNLYRIWQGEIIPGVDTGYWRADFQNNHVFGRTAGMLMATSAIIATPGCDYEFDPLVRDMFNHAVEQLHRIVYWTAPDGTTHEGIGYRMYGAEKLIRALAVYESVTGDTSLWDFPSVYNIRHLHAFAYAPGMNKFILWGTHSGPGLGHNAAYLFRLARQYQDEQFMGMLREIAVEYHRYVYTGHFNTPTKSLLWYDDSLGSQEWNRPLFRHFDDLEMVHFRTGWDVNDMAFSMKSGPPGGHRLNEYVAFRTPTGTFPHWVNVAHSMPEAQNISISFGGHYWGTHPQTLRRNIPRYTRHHNTMLVSGGQRAFDGQSFETRTTGFSGRYVGMGQAARVTEFFGTDGFGFAASCARNAYRNTRAGTAVGAVSLGRYYRSMFFIGNRYMVTIDDISMAGAQTGTFTYIFRNNGDWSGDLDDGFVITQTTTGSITTEPVQMELHVLSTVNANAELTPPIQPHLMRWLDPVSVSDGGTFPDWMVYWYTRPVGADPSHLVNERDSRMVSYQMLGTELAVSNTTPTNAAQFAGVYFPRVDGETLYATPTIEVVGTGVNAFTRVTVERDGLTDEILYRTTRGNINLSGEIDAVARTVFYTSDDDGIVNSVMIDGTTLNQQEIPAFTSTQPINLRYERGVDGGFNLNISRPLTSNVATSYIAIDNLEPNTFYAFATESETIIRRSSAMGHIVLQNFAIAEPREINVSISTESIAAFTEIVIVGNPIDGMNVQLNGVNTINEVLTGFVFLAKYDTNGRMLNAITAPVNIDVNYGAFSEFVWDNAQDINSDTEYIRAFLWGSASTMTPILMNSINITGE